MLTFMKRNIQLLFSFCLLIVLTASDCKKPKPNNPSTLTIETTPAAGSNAAPAPGPDFPLVVRITSSVPNGGVKIDVIARAEGSTIPFYSATVHSSNSVNNFLVTGAPVGVTSVVDVTATDLSNPANTASSSYRFSRK
jgi:hypothetical protein